MAIQEIAVNMSLLRSDIHILEETIAALRKQMSDLSAQMEELNAVWDGPAKMEFVSQFQMDYTNMENMCKTIDSIIACCRYAEKEYHFCENGVHDLVAAISI